MTRTILCFFLMGLPILHAAGTAEYVVIIVWDGMRPDFVTPENTPTLSQLAAEGVFFNRHHPVYPSSTEVNGTTLFTGMYPENSGIVGNREFRPLISPFQYIATENMEAVRKGDSDTDGKYLAAPTLFEILQAKGFPTAVTGTKPVVFLADRAGHRTSEAARTSSNVYKGHALPAEKLAEVEKLLGTFPEEVTYPNTGQNTWTMRALTDLLWKPNIPKLSLLWLSDPDYPQHHTQPGSAEAIATLKTNDQLLARLLAKLETAGVRDKTDILIVSDHGFSTIERNADLSALLIQAGFRAFRKFTTTPQSGDILVVGNGGSVFFYVTNHDRDTVRKLVEFLQQGDYAGVIFSKIPLPGTFELSAANINSASAPDVVLSLRWNDSANASGVKGGLVSEGNPLTSRSPGQGMHGSLSVYDMRNTLIAAGPDFRKGLINDLPSGNTDVAPTILWILGIEPPQKMDGRVLVEALVHHPGQAPKEEQKSLTASKGAWSQYLKTSKVGNTLYLDEGNGKQTPK